LTHAAVTVDGRLFHALEPGSDKKRSIMQCRPGHPVTTGLLAIPS